LVVHNKAIRDKVPEIIKNSGYDCDVRQLSDQEFLAELEKKLSEELDEYQKSKEADELADLLEVIYRIAELRGIKKSDLEQIRQEKQNKRGAFSKNLFLIDTSE